MKDAVMELTARERPMSEMNSGAIVPLAEHKMRTVPERSPRIPNFHLVECCGRGGFGAVYLGIDRDGVRRAIRVVRREKCDSQIAECESAAIANYRNLASGHRHLLDILYAGRTRSCIYYVMPLADRASGPNCRYRPLTLAEKIRQNDLPESSKLRIIRDIASAVAFLHAHGVAHRDLKPENILFVDGVVKVADPGMLAPEWNVGCGGTREFSPPQPTDGRSADIYALGIIIYCIFTGLPAERFPELPEFWNTPFYSRLNRIVLHCCPQDGSTCPPTEAVVAALERLEAPSSPDRRTLRRAWLHARNSAALWLSAGLLLWGMFSCADSESRKVPPQNGTDTIAAGTMPRSRRSVSMTETLLAK